MSEIKKARVKAYMRRTGTGITQVMEHERKVPEGILRPEAYQPSLFGEKTIQAVKTINEEKKPKREMRMRPLAPSAETEILKYTKTDGSGLPKMMSDLAGLIYKEIGNDPLKRAYAIIKPSDGKGSQFTYIKAGESLPQGWEFISQEGIRGGKTKEEIEKFITKNFDMYHGPVLALEEEIEPEKPTEKNAAGDPRTPTLRYDLSGGNKKAANWIMDKILSYPGKGGPFHIIYKPSNTEQGAHITYQYEGEELPDGWRRATKEPIAEGTRGQNEKIIEEALNDTPYALLAKKPDSAKIKSATGNPTLKYAKLGEAI